MNKKQLFIAAVAVALSVSSASFAATDITGVTATMVSTILHQKK